MEGKILDVKTMNRGYNNNIMHDHEFYNDDLYDYNGELLPL